MLAVAETESGHASEVGTQQGFGLKAANQCRYAALRVSVGLV